MALGGVLLFAFTSEAASAVTKCPATHNGKPLQDVEVYDGPPDAGGQPLPPDDEDSRTTSRWVIQAIPKALWDSNPPYYLGCKYRREAGLVGVQIPRGHRVCKVTRTNTECR